MEASAHRYRAREALRGNWVIAVLVCLVAGILSGMINLRCYSLWRSNCAVNAGSVVDSAKC